MTGYYHDRIRISPVDFLKQTQPLNHFDIVSPAGILRAAICHFRQGFKLIPCYPASILRMYFPPFRRTKEFFFMVLRSI